MCVKEQLFNEILVDIEDLPVSLPMFAQHPSTVSLSDLALLVQIANCLEQNYMFSFGETAVLSHTWRGFRAADRSLLEMNTGIA